MSLGALAICGLAGCKVQDAISPGVVVPVHGDWRYVSEYVVPGPVSVDGSVRLFVDSDGSVSGTASFVERSAGAADRAIAGTLSGRGVDISTVEFDLTIDGGVRRHVGVLAGDSLTGSWVLTSASSTPVGARFRAARTR
jgi:hypothetical protein